MVVGPDDDLSPPPMPRSPSSSGSTIADPNLDHESPIVDSSPTRTTEPDPRNRLQHLLTDDSPSTRRDPRRETISGDLASSPPTRATWPADENRDLTEDEAEVAAKVNGHRKSTTTAIDADPPVPGGSARRGGHTAAPSSIYGGNKMKNIKKEDGIPLWRVDIQYEFLRAVFDDQTKVFTSVRERQGGATFADIYIEAMAWSPKSSKILREKLLSDRSSALNMAMVCLLVDVGEDEYDTQL